MKKCVKLFYILSQNERKRKENRMNLHKLPLVFSQKVYYTVSSSKKIRLNQGSL